MPSSRAPFKSSFLSSCHVQQVMEAMQYLTNDMSEGSRDLSACFPRNLTYQDMTHVVQINPKVNLSCDRVQFLR